MIKVVTFQFDDIVDFFKFRTETNLRSFLLSFRKSNVFTCYADENIKRIAKSYGIRILSEKELSQ